MEGYLDRMLALQALAAGNTQAAEELLQRMRTTQMNPAAEKTTIPEQNRGAAVRGTADGEPLLPEEAAMNGTGQTQRETAHAEMAHAEAARAEAARTQLLERLTMLAEPWMALPDAGREQAFDAAEAWNRSSTQVALEQMRQRLTRAVQSGGALTAQTLPADGARDIAPGGTADAAALSRMFERDARRYDGCFEMPL